MSANSYSWLVFVLSAGCVCGYITWIAVRLPLQGFVAAPGAPWPMPQSWENSSDVITLDPVTFEITSDIPGCDVIDDAIRRYKSLIVLDPDGAIDPDLTPITRLTITIQNKTCHSNYYPHYDMNESYLLTVNTTLATLRSNTIWAALRGLETFSQLIYLTDDKKYRINETNIEDFPRFAHRGLMIDTARHFIRTEIILNILDAMSWDKFNVLHWHFVDDQSFPYPSRTYPNLTEKGSYTPYHRYTRDNITAILREARLRGIRVIPEFDTPGHTWSWGLAYPELVTPCWGEGLEGGPYKPNYPLHGDREILYPASETTYQFLDNFYQEIVEDFPDQFVHLGMDEVYYACWKSNPNISDWMIEMNFTEYYEVEQHYSQRLVDIVNKKGSEYVIWQDPIENGVQVSASTLVQIWKSEDDIPWQTYMLNVTSLGYTTLLSSPWYLNYISYGQDWKNYYLEEPYSFTNDSQLWKLVKGGEACIWAEYIDGTNILSTLWPRASSVAERLWSNKNVNNVDDAQYRLDQQRCRMLRRGIPAQPILNGYCGDYEWYNPV